MFHLLVLLSVTLKTVTAVVQDEKCYAGIEEITFLKRDSEEGKCSERDPCLLKCCSEKNILQAIPGPSNSEYSCVSHTHTLNRNSTKVANTSISFKDFHIYYNDAFVRCASVFPFVPDEYNLLKNGTAMISWSGLKLVYVPLSFCIDLALTDKKDLEIKYLMLPDRVDTACINYKVYGMLISAFFMFMVIVVKVILRQYHSMSDRLFVTYIAMLMLAYTDQIVSLLYFNGNVEQCKIATPIVWFLNYSSFFWLSVMSWDIWWTFRGFRLQRSIHRDGLNRKYRNYGLYAWGIPLLLIIAEVIFDANYEGEMRPDFEQCGRSNTLIFFYIPIIILTIANCTLFILTITNIWMIKKSSEIANSSSNQTNKNSFAIVAKLSLMTGFSWILEVVQAFTYGENCSWGRNVLDSYNFFLGVLIFVVFLCNKATLKEIRKRFKNESTVHSVQTSSISQSPSKKSWSSRTQPEEKPFLETTTTTMQYDNKVKGGWTMEDNAPLKANY